MVGDHRVPVAHAPVHRGGVLAIETAQEVDRPVRGAGDGHDHGDAEKPPEVGRAQDGEEAAGALTGDKDLESEGKADRAAGEVKEKVGDVKDKVDDAVDKVKDVVHHT